MHISSFSHVNCRSVWVWRMQCDALSAAVLLHTQTSPTTPIDSMSLVMLLLYMSPAVNKLLNQIGNGTAAYCLLWYYEYRQRYCPITVISSIT